jgi:rod shape-determining protein MreC
MQGIIGKKNLLIFGAILVLLVFFNFIGWLDFVKSPLRRLIAPIFTKANNLSVKVGVNYEFFKNKELFFESYGECRLALENEAVEKAKIKILEDENALLKSALGFRERTKLASVTARIVGKNIEKTDQTLLIDRGTEEGIKIEQPVIVGDGILVGKIVKSEKGMAIVRLINDSQSKIAATVLSVDRSIGVVEGGYGLSVKMNFIPRNEVVRIDDLITTSGLEPNIPKGLMIGTVTAIENETYRPFQAAVLAPGTDLSKLSIVSVLVEL